VGKRPDVTATTRVEHPVDGRVSSQGATFVSTPAEVLYANEIMRGRMWVAICVLLGAGGVASAILLEAPGLLARQLLGIGSAVILGGSVLGLWILRRESNYSPRLAVVYSYSCLIAILPALHFFGWFSAIALLIALAAVIFAMGHSARAVFAMAVAVIGSHTALAGFTIAGTIPNRAIAMVVTGSLVGQILCLVGCEVAFGLSFLIGRLLRTQMLSSVESYGLAVQESARREALLQEAREELLRARKIGSPGRYTGLELGSYRLGVVLGRGGMGEVYEAIHTKTGEPAAVKVMTAAAMVDARAIRRFEREIDLAAAVDSPHIVRMLEHSVAHDSVLYLAMERLDGAALADDLHTVRRLHQSIVLTMLRQVAKGISAAHAAGVIHRDLSPRNIFRHRNENEEVWKILDFGVSKLIGSQPSLTGSAIVGTPGYISPEQAKGAEVDHRCDLFALGCVAYRCLTGRPAFRGDALADIVYRVVNETPLRPSRIAPLPPAVDLVMAIALAKDREHRFADADAFVLALEDACAGRIDEELERRGEALVALHPWPDSGHL